MTDVKGSQSSMCKSVIVTTVTIVTSLLLFSVIRKEGLLQFRPVVTVVQEATTAECEKVPVVLDAQSGVVDARSACRDAGRDCGQLLLAGQVLVSCGDCQFPSTCGGGGAPNRCGCQPMDCGALKRTCGSFPDGCGGQVLCGPPCPPSKLGSPSQPLPTPARPFRVGYMTHWAQYNEGSRKFTAQNIQARLFTHVVYTYVFIDENDFSIGPSLDNEVDFQLEGHSRPGVWRQFVEACRAGGAVPMVGFGGDTVKWSKLFGRLLDSPKATEAFPRQLVRWLKEYRFSGVNFDVQLMPEGREEEWMALLTALRAALQELSIDSDEDMWLTVDTYPGIWNIKNRRALARVVDFVTLKVFHMRAPAFGASASEPFRSGPHSSLFGGPMEPSVNATVSEWLASGVPASQLLVAISCEAQVWELQGRGTPGMGQPVRTQGADGKAIRPSLVPLAELKLLGDGDLHLGQLHIPSATMYGYTGQSLVVYDGKESVGLKIDYIIQKGLGGVCLISIDMDNDSELATAIADKLQVQHQDREQSGGGRMLVTSSYASPCASLHADHLLARGLKNKVDYARLHGWTLYENRCILDIPFRGMFTKVVLLRSLAMKHPEVEWFVWMDADAFFSDLTAEVPFERYAGFDIVIQGAPSCAFNMSTPGGPSWLCMNAGVLLLRNTPWLRKWMDVWISFADVGKLRENKAKIKKALSGKALSVDDQSAFHYLLLTDSASTSKVFLEADTFWNTWWEHAVGRLEEFQEQVGPGLVWAPGHAPPLVTHFTGCCVCCDRGALAEEEVERCQREMDRVLNFADNQVQYMYGQRHVDFSSMELVPLTDSQRG